MDDTKLIATQQIERLKKKIAIYKETLTTLKKGTSIEDFQNKKEEFNGFKLQIAHLEGITNTIDEKECLKNETYAEKVKQILNQIDLLNQTVEEMNKDISSLTKDRNVEYNEHQGINLNLNLSTAPSSLQAKEQLLDKNEDTSQEIESILLSNKPPSYMQLQILAGPAFPKKEYDNLEQQVDHNPLIQNTTAERHFNELYFQSNHTHPNQIYNGLYKNITNTSKFHFKNESSIQEIPFFESDSPEIPLSNLADATVNTVGLVTENFESSNTIAGKIDGERESIIIPNFEVKDSSETLINDIKDTNTNLEEINYSDVPNVNDNPRNVITEETIDSSVVATVDDIEISNTTPDETALSIVSIVEDSEISDTTIEEIDDVIVDTPIEELINPLDSLNENGSEERKKEGFSSFLNLFRRRN